MQFDKRERLTAGPHDPGALVVAGDADGAVPGAVGVVGVDEARPQRVLARLRFVDDPARPLFLTKIPSNEAKKRTTQNAMQQQQT